MKEEYSAKETEYYREYESYSENNAETGSSEFDRYSPENADPGSEHPDYASETQGRQALPRHSTVLRGKRTRMGRLLGMLASVAAPAAVVMIVTSSTMLADVVAYDAQPEYLEVKLSLYSSSEDTKFQATLRSANGPLLYVMPVDRNNPSLRFYDLVPGEEYVLEVYGDEDRLLSLSYILPEEEIPPEETTDEEGTTTEEPGGETEPSGNPPSTRPVETGQQTEPGQTDPAQTDPEQTEPEQTEPEQTEPEQTEPEQTEPEQTEPEQTEPEQTEPEQTEPEQTEPEQTEPEQTEPEQTEPEQTEPEQTEPEQTEPAPVPSASFVSSSVTYDSVTVILSYENVSANSLSAAFNGQAATLTFGNEGTAVISASGLNPDTSYAWSLQGPDGTTLASGNVRTAARTRPTITETDFTQTLTGAEITFSISNPDSNTISATLDGTACTFRNTGSSLYFNFSGLAEGSSHTLKILDWDGATLVTYPFLTRMRTPAQMAVQSFTSDLSTASGSFSLTNPDGNTITAKLNGNTIQPAISGNTVSVSFTGLAEGSSHTLVFYDYNGSTILSYPFTTRSRTPATVTFSSVTPGFNGITATFSVSNPDGNTLQLRLNGTQTSANLTGTSPQINLTGLNPRTAYTLTVYDSSTGRTAAETRTTTGTSMTVSQNTAGDATFTLTDAFKAVYPAASVTIALTDSYSQTVNVTAGQTAGQFIASASDIIYADTYTAVLSYNGTAVDTLSFSLTGNARPSFTLTYSGYGPATTSEALTDDYHSSSVSYPAYTYTLNSGYIPLSEGDDASPAGTAGSTTAERFTALFLRNSSGAPVRVALAGWSDCDMTSVGYPTELYFNESQLDPELTAGTYTAAFWTLDGYTSEQISDLLWGQNENTSNAQTMANVFWNSGRRISSFVTVTIANTQELDYGYIYTRSNPVASTNGYYYTCECSYSPVTEGGNEGFFTIVSASDPTVQLITPVSLGTASNYGQTVSRQFVQSTSPVFAIIYSGSFNPSNFLYVLYIDPANP